MLENMNPKKTESITSLNELQTTDDVEIPKHETHHEFQTRCSPRSLCSESSTVTVQKFDSVENSMLRLRQFEVAKTVLCIPETCELECQKSTDSKEG